MLSNIKDPGFEYIACGGYANIYYNSKTKAISKEQPYYDEYDNKLDNSNNQIIKYVCSSTIYDNILSSAFVFNKIYGTVRVEDIIVNKADNVIYQHMPYYGICLQNYIKSEKYKASLDNTLSIVLSITNTCVQLYDLGIQHTDIKPTNILYNLKTCKITLIDYNILSIRSSAKSRFGWSYGIGTWSYVAPEIVEYEEPSDTSMVWSIGIHIAYLYYGYPNLSLRKVLHTVVERKDWITIYKNLQKGSEFHFPLSLEHRKRMPASLIQLYIMCTQWNWKLRPTIHSLYQTIEGLFTNTTNPLISSLNLQLNNRTFKNLCSIVPYPNNDHRQLAIDFIWKLCKESDNIDIFSKTCILYDKYTYTHDQYSLIGCIYTAYILTGVILSDNTFRKTINKYIDITTEQINDSIINVCKSLKWNCYSLSPDIIIIDLIKKKYNYKWHEIYDFMHSKRVYKLLYDVFCEINKPYTTESIAMIAYKEIQ
jgi:serine/threonine protein kinase